MGRRKRQPIALMRPKWRNPLPRLESLEVIPSSTLMTPPSLCLLCGVCFAVVLFCSLDPVLVWGLLNMLVWICSSSNCALFILLFHSGNIYLFTRIKFPTSFCSFFLLFLTRSLPLGRHTRSLAKYTVCSVYAAIGCGMLTSGVNSNLWCILRRH